MSITSHGIQTYFLSLLSSLLLFAVASALSPDLRTFRDGLLLAFGFLMISLTAAWFFATRWWNPKTAGFESHNKLQELERAAAMCRIAEQVSHDIRSPLATLAAISVSSRELDEQSRIMIRTAIHRIHKIANHLLDQSPEAAFDTEASPLSPLSSLSEEERSSEPLSALVESAVAEKRIQLQHRPRMEIAADLSKSYSLCAEVQPIELSRILSNLLDNAIEALPEAGRVALTLIEEGDKVSVRITDDGKGIPPEVLNHLGQYGETHGKENGSGLGLFHARTTLASWGGELNIDSTVEQGTTVTISLPKATPPDWFLDQLKLHPETTIVVLDDDPKIHQVWDQRFASFYRENPKSQVIHFKSTEELTRWYRETLGGIGSTIYLCDHELIGSKQTGLDVIDLLGIRKDSVLVTSHADELPLRQKCEKLGVRLLPKMLAPFVPVSSA